MLNQESDCCTYIPFEKTGFFSKTVIDYLNESSTIRDFYGAFPKLENFQDQISKRALASCDRKVLVDVLKEQYDTINTSDLTNKHIHLLAQENTFTVTTGHQLNLFSGPLYFFYKIISTINLCEELTTKYPKQNFVPIYWMASEDHDFEEINYFNFKGKKIRWNSTQKGAVGRFSTEKLEEVFKVFSSELNMSTNAKELRELFQKAYLEHNTLSDATRYMVNELFSVYGLVIIDADHVKLKHKFIPYVQEELLKQTSFIKVAQTINDFKKKYKVQVNPREINLFYLTDNVRERIIFEDGLYKVVATDLIFTQEEILIHLEKYPERFSPNVILRPLYQEIILPNICYIGGGGELAYWLELKKYFETMEVDFPILLLRNSVQLVSQKQMDKLSKLSISKTDVFTNQQSLINSKVIENSTNKVDFSVQKEFLRQQFQDLRLLAKNTDKSFIGAVNAQEKKQLKGLINLENRWIRAEKRNQQELVERIVNLQNELLPNQSLEERQRNFSEFYQEYGREFIVLLKQNLRPLKHQFAILHIKNNK